MKSVFARDFTSDGAGLPGCARAARYSCFLAGVLTLVCVLFVPRAAQARELQIQQLDARVTVDPAGWIEVTEAIQVHFLGAWQGLYRSIPVEYQRDDGHRFVLSLQVREVRDGQGEPLRYQADRAGGRQTVRVFVPGAVDATRTIVITYRCPNALRFLNDHDELYWNVTGNDWDAPIQAAAARVSLPGRVTGVRARVFTGVTGSREQDADIQLDASTVAVRARHPLALHEGLTVVVDWDKGFVKESQWLLSVGGLITVGFPAAAFLLLFGLWLARRRGPTGPPVGVLYQPPREMTPAEVGTLADNRVDARNVTATIVDLAVRGYLTIEQQPPTTYRGQFAFRRSESQQWTSLATYEQVLLGAIFSGQERIVATSDLPASFRQNLSLFRTQVFEALLRRGFYLTSPERTCARYRWAGFLIGVLVSAVAAVASLRLSDFPVVPFLVGGLTTGVIVAVFGRIMSTRTEQGVRALEEIRGFKRFLAQVGEGGEQSREVARTPDVFDAFLAYGIALKVEEGWVRAFQGLYTEPGEWYRSAEEQAFNLHNPPGNLGDLSRTIAAQLSPAGSGDSSSGGDGGSSGGGDGGGGGGGF